MVETSGLRIIHCYSTRGGFNRLNNAITVNTCPDNVNHKGCVNARINCDITENGQLTPSYIEVCYYFVNG